MVRIDTETRTTYGLRFLDRQLQQLLIKNKSDVHKVVSLGLNKHKNVIL